MSNSDYTRDVAERGLQAVRDRRQSTQYGPNNRDAALEYLLSSGYGRPAPTQAYGQWAQSRGFQPQGYEIAVGQGGGKYNGFETEGQLKSAVLGRSEMLRSQDQSHADQLARLADQYLSDAESQYGTQLQQGSEQIGRNVGYNPAQAGARDLASTFTGMFDAGPESEFDMLAPVQRAVAKVPELAYDQGTGEYEDTLNQWLGDTTAPYLDAIDTAQQIGSTPLRDYATLAGAEYGVDPNIVGGWYPTDSMIGDFRDQRDISAIEQFGMTDGEYQQFIDQQLRQQDQDAQSEQQGYDQQVADAIFQVTSMDAGQLAQAADLDVEQLYSVVASEPYTALNGMLGEIVATPEQDEQTIRQQVDDALAQASADPALYRVLYAQWGGYGGAD